MNILRIAALGLCFILGNSAAFAECATETYASDDSISVSFDPIDRSASAREFAWLLSSAIDQLLLRGEMTVRSAAPTALHDHDNNAITTAYALHGGVLVSGDRVRVTIKLINSARSDIVWMETFDRSIKDDAYAAADEIAHKTIQEIIEVASDRTS